MGILYNTYKQDKEKRQRQIKDEFQDILQGVATGGQEEPSVPSVTPEQRARIYAQWMLGTTKPATKPTEKVSTAKREAPPIPDELIAESLRKAAERRRAEESARLGIKRPPLRPGESVEFARKHPTLRTVLYYATAPLRTVFEQPFVRRTGEAGAEVFTGVRTPRTPTGSKVADVAAELVGTMMGFATGGPRTAVQSVGGQLWTGAERLAERALTRLAPRVAASGMAKRAITGAAATVPYDVTFAATNEEPLDPKTMAITALAGGLLNVLPEGIATLAARRRQVALPPPRAEVKPPEVTPEAPPAPPKTPETPVEPPKPKEPVTVFKAGDRVEWTDTQGNTLTGKIVRSRGFLVEVRTPDGATVRVSRAKVRKVETAAPPPEQPPVPPTTPERPPLVTGKTAVAKTERGTAVETEFAVVNAEALEAALRKAGVTGEEAEAAQAALFGDEAVRGPLAAPKGAGAGERIEPGAGRGVEGKPGEGPGVKGLPWTRKTGAAAGAGQATGEPVKRIDIVRYLEEKLLVPIRTGRVVSRQWAGQYDIRQEVVRTAKAEDLETIAHEVGHHLTKKLGLNYNTYPELERIGARLYPDAKPSLQREEGLGEFFRYYLVQPKLAEQAAPTFYRDFEALLGRVPELEQVMREAQRVYRDWFAQDAVDHVKGVIVSETVREKPWLNPVEKFHADWKDALYPLYKFVKTVYGKEPEFISQDAYKLARLAMGRVRKAWAMLERAAFLPDGTVVGPSLRDILKPVRDRIDDFTAYITARRAVELHGRGIETGIDPAKAFEAVRQLDSPEFRKALDDLQAYQDALLVHLVDAGVLSAKQAALFKQLNRDYVPFYRFFGGEETVQRYLGKRFADLPQAVRRIKGSTRSIIDPLESIVKNTIYFIDLAERNRVGRAVADAADKTEGLGWLIEKLPTPKQATKFELERIRKDLIAAGVPEDALDQANLQQIATVFHPLRYARPTEKKENILTVWRDGKPAFYKCHPDLYRALEMLDEPAAHWFVRLLSFPARTLRLGAVLNPEFIARNPARDQLTAFLQSRYGFVPVVDLIRGMYHVFRRTDVYKQWEASGGAMATLTSLDRDYLQGALRRVLGKQTAKERALNVAAAPVKFLQFLSESLEEASRVGEFSKGLRKELAKGTPDREARLRAAFASREVTLDFSRAGRKGRQANQMIAFFNAALEGPSMLKRTFQRDPVGATVRAAALITLPSILLYARNHSKPEYEAVYQELPRWRKDLYWCIPTDDGKIYYIPKPFEAGVLFGSFFERALEYIKEKDPKAFKDWLESATTVFSPGFIPTALIPIIEIWSNRSFFTRRPIVPMREQKLEPEEQYDPHTSETAKLIGRMFNVSPRYVEQAVRGYFGGLGMHALNLLDLLSGEALEKQHLFEVTPFERAFVGAPWRSAESIEEFYKELDRLETKYYTAKEKLERGEKPTREELPDMERLRRLRAADKYLQQGRQLIRKIRADQTLSPEEKREKLDRINLQMVNIARLALGKKPERPISAIPQNNTGTDA